MTLLVRIDLGFGVLLGTFRSTEKRWRRTIGEALPETEKLSQNSWAGAPMPRRARASMESEESAQHPVGDGDVFSSKTVPTSSESEGSIFSGFLVGIDAVADPFCPST